MTETLNDMGDEATCTGCGTTMLIVHGGCATITCPVCGGQLKVGACN